MIHIGKSCWLVWLTTICKCMYLHHVIFAWCCLLGVYVRPGIHHDCSVQLVFGCCSGPLAATAAILATWGPLRSWHQLLHLHCQSKDGVPPTWKQWIWIGIRKTQIANLSFSIIQVLQVYGAKVLCGIPCPGLPSLARNSFGMRFGSTCNKNGRSEVRWMSTLKVLSHKFKSIE